MTNDDFMEKWIEEDTHKGNGHLLADGNTLLNYSTIICVIDRENKSAKLNTRKYSRTTGKIQSSLSYLLSKNGFNITEYEGEPCEPWNCGYMGAPHYNSKGKIVW